jgi:hypothetical protein
MSRDSDSSLFITVVVVGLVSAALYFVLLRPLLPGTAQRAAPAGTAGAARGSAGQAAATANNNNNNANTNAPSIPKEKCTRTPPHVAPGSAELAVNGGSNILIDGLLAFRHSRAALWEKKLDAAEQTVNRKDRARILSRLLEEEIPASSSSSAPPAKGSTIVVSIPEEDVGCSKLRRVLHLLATYYNLLVILAVPSAPSKEERTTLIAKLRGLEDDDDNKKKKKSSSSSSISAASAELLPVDVLPDHRIIASSTSAGRVAFVRQVSRIELILDFDPEVKSILARFGHRVIAYGDNMEDGGSDAAGTSRLGRQLLA